MALNKPGPFLSFNGGYVDTLGFLLFNGLFTAHVTGNFVTIGAALAYGSSGIITKLLALPVFCLTIVISRLAGKILATRGWRELRLLLWTMLILLTLAAIMVSAFGPFRDADAPAAMFSGLVLVAAMAIQNAVHRGYLTKEAPGTLMTGTTTQIMLDLADLMTGRKYETRMTLCNRLKKLGISLLFFTSGCGMAALAFILTGKWGVLLPPVTVFFSWIAIENAVKDGFRNN